MGVILRVEQLRLSFGGVVAADSVDLTVSSNEILAIVGANGSGKTTFLNVCTGYLKPQQGEVYFGEIALSRLKPRAITRLGIARSFQIPQLFLNHTVLENLLLSVASRQGFWRPLALLERSSYIREAEAALRLLRLESVASKRACELSEGTRKLTDIAIALALRPCLLFMDEPTSGVSSNERFAIMDNVMNAVAQARATAVFVEHDMEVVRRYAHRVAIWEAGRIVAQGNPYDLLTDDRHLQTAF